MVNFAFVFLTFVVGGFASAQSSYEGDVATLNQSRAGKQLSGDGEFSANIQTNIYKVTERLEPVWENVWECDESTGDGKEGDWKGFYNAPQSEKPNRLADAIAGVGLATARRLVEDNYFYKKPRSWKEFRSVIQNADGVYKTGFSYEVLVKHGDTNMQNLGYKSSTNCRMERTLVWKLVKHRTFYQTVSKQFKVEYSHAPLLANESEVFEIRFDGVALSVVPSSKFNKYKLVREWTDSQGVQVYAFEAQRIRINPENTLSIVELNSGNKVLLRVSDSAFDKEIATQNNSVVEYEIYKKRAWYQKDIKLHAAVEVLSKDSALTSIQTPVASAADLYVKYQIRHSASPYYSDKPSRTLKTK